MSKLLVVDDEQSICWGLNRVGRDLGHEVTIAASAEAALDVASRQRPDVVVLDVRLPGMSGLEAMALLRQHVGRAPIIVITAYGDLETAVQAVRQGAFDYVVKPFDALRIRQVLSRALEFAAAAPISAAPISASAGFIGAAPAMQEVFNRIALAADSQACVLLQGESGTGKELAARAIHRFDARGGPFVAVNVAALNPALVESELFGHVRGAFTGAEQPRAGLLEQAAGGMLFLDEVAEMPLATQVKLLRVLETREVVPVGANQPVRSDFRLVCATHQDLPRQVRQGQFRHDLYFRISAFRIDLPPLRERRGDIAPLAEYFIQSLTRELPTATSARLSDAARLELERRPWHGNVRELRNVIEHALIVVRGGTIQPEHLPTAAGDLSRPANEPPEAVLSNLIAQWSAARLRATDATGALYDQFLAVVEPPLLKVVLDDCGGQHAPAARMLGMHRTTLRKKLAQYGLLGDEPARGA